MSKDRYRDDGSLLFSDNNYLKTTNGSSTDTLWTSSETITGFLQTSSSHVLLPDYWRHCIRDLDRANNQVSVLYGVCGTSGSTDGQGKLARFNHPQSIITDKLHFGKLLVADRFNRAIRSIESQSGKVSTVVQYLSSRPKYMEWYEESLLVTSEHQIHVITWNDRDEAAAAVLTGSTTSGYRDGTFSSARFSYPSGISYLSPHMFLVIDYGNQNIRLLDMRNRRVLPACVESLCNISFRFTAEPDSVLRAEDSVYVGLKGQVLQLSGEYNINVELMGFLL